jgi:hypothetical protein
MISSLINKEFININSPINIASSKIDNKYFDQYLKKVFPSSIVYSFENTYYGNMEPSIIICNNRISHLDKSVELAKYFHCPLLIIDHELKSELITNKIVNNFMISPVIQIALSKNIHLSWNKIHNYILWLDDNSIAQWRNIIYNLCKQTFTIKISNEGQSYEKNQISCQ